jgi:hypothetical protein
MLRDGWLGFDGRVFLTEEEHATYMRRMPVRYSAEGVGPPLRCLPGMRAGSHARKPAPGCPQDPIWDRSPKPLARLEQSTPHRGRQPYRYGRVPLARSRC